ncbi:MAG: Ribulose-phosphate 3-epimerase [candidate division TM6 bacterium GW2011_GWE2_42_60]|nr:MAG: Ribulose-phosphate 3-epimerase [candidate division TM6 bacterium GW2011_GWE2_42_60]HBY05451.1 hypothetical protein [Candidatus Dependentiae bacterium]
MIALYPSLMAADLLNLKSEISALEPLCSGFHLDIMDHSFVPNLTWGTDMVNAIRLATKKPLWIDLLVDQPSFYIDQMHLNAGDIVTVHYESKSIINNREVVASITSALRAKGIIASLAINPKTPTKTFAPFLDLIDHAQLMSVDPGFSGRPFFAGTPSRLLELQALLKAKNKKLLIGVDGGINETTFLSIKNLGVNMVAIGSGIFARPDKIKALKWYRQ